MKWLSGYSCMSLVFMFLISSGSAAGEVSGWVDVSNQNTMLLLHILKKFNPETAASFGITGVDSAIFDLTPGYNDRKKAAYQDARAELEKRLPEATIPEVKQDIQILLLAVDETLEDLRLDEKYMLPYFNPAQSVFYSLQALLDDQIESERRPAALARKLAAVWTRALEFGAGNARARRSNARNGGIALSPQHKCR